MVDRRARIRFAEAIRALVAGRITNDEFEDVRMAAIETDDEAIAQIHEKGVWTLYSDLHEHHLRGAKAITREHKREVARWILFLRTDLPYEWPRPGGFQSVALLLANAFTLGLASRAYSKRLARHGCVEAWPFIRESDLQAARRSAGYLGMEHSSTTQPFFAGPA